MTSVTFYLAYFLEANALLALVCLALKAGLHLKERSPRRFSAVALSLASRWLVVGALVIPFCARLIPREVLLKPSVQIWSSLDRRAILLSPVATMGHGGPIPLASLFPDRVGWQLQLSRFLLLVLFLGAAYGLCRLGRVYLRLERLLSRAAPVRRIGQVALCVSDEIAVPFAFSRPFGGAYVVLPPDALLDSRGFCLGVRHELQHHRGRDTLWAQLAELLRACFFPSPVVHAVAALMSQLQEIACDEVLITCRNVSAQAYGRCLIEAAERAVDSRLLLAGTTGMAAGSAGSTLKRRVVMLFEHKTSTSSRRRPMERWLAVGTLVLMGSLAFASKSVIQDRRISLADARKMAAGGPSDSAFPLVVNGQVLDALNRYLGTPNGRQMIQSGLARVPQYQDSIEDYLNEYGLPEEILAVPLVESAYQNLQPSRTSFHSAGLWQFVPGTARAYGLEVGDGIDERMDVEKETDAAMRYLDGLYLRFQDWGLAIASYNQGEVKVQTAIDQTGIRDAWKLAQMGRLNDYFADVVAAALILKNPSLAH